MAEKNIAASKKQKPQLVKIFCYVCKKHYEYTVLSPGDAHKRFDSMGHSSQKVARLAKNLGRGVKVSQPRHTQRGNKDRSTK